MTQDDDEPIAATALARWLRLLKLLFTVITLAIAILRAIGILSPPV